MEKKLPGYKKLIVYQRMIRLIVLVYELMKLLPDEEKYGLKSQMKRAAVSVLSNFVEGYLKKSIREKDQFLERSTTSLHELDAQADVCLYLGYWSDVDYSRFSLKHREVAYLLFRYRGTIQRQGIYLLVLLVPFVLLVLLL